MRVADGRRSPGVIAAVTLVMALLLGSCTTEDGEPTPTAPTVPPAPTKVDALASLVPESIRDSGVLTIGTDPSYPPMEYTTGNGDEVAGVDIDLASGIAAVLGLEPQFRLDAYSALTTGVRAGRYDMGIASLTITPKTRLRSNAVLYFRSGSQLVRGVAHEGLTPQSMCGYAIAAIEGSIQVQQLTDADQDCRDEGREPIDIVALSTQDEVTNSVVVSDTAGMLSDRPVAEYAVSRNAATLQLSGRTFDLAPLGILVSSDFPKLTRAIKGAVQTLMATGYYDAVLRAWSTQSGAIDRAKIVWAD